MKAVFQSRYGEPDAVLELREVPVPVCGDHDVLVRVLAASVHADVWHGVTGCPALLRLMGSGVLRPKNPIPGTDLAGRVEAVGKNVTQFRVGDDVFGETLGANLWMNGGTFAEFAIAPETALALKPAAISFAQAVAVTTPGIIALNNLQPPRAIRPGWNVLINGAGGGVGSFAVPWAKAQGARVTAIDDARRQPLLHALGADVVIDYAREDFMQRDACYDLIFDVASNLSFAACKRKLKPDGLFVLIGHDHYGKNGRRWLGSVPEAFALAARSILSPQLRPAFHSPVPKPEALAVLRELLETQKLTPVIAQTYPLAEVRAAMRHLVSGEACGRIILTP